MENKTSFHKFMDATNPVKIELALVDEFNKLYQDAINAQAKSETMIVDYNEMASKISSLLNQVGQSYLRANAKFADVEQAAKDLGVEVSSPLKNQKETIAKAIKEVDAYVKKLASNKIPM